MSIFNLFNKKSNSVPEGLVSKLAKNEIVISVDTDAGVIPPQASKLGGKPWLPRDFQWPVYESDEIRPLAFLCQINLEEVSPYDRDRVLPTKGMLYFFYECDAFCWGFDPKDKGCARVFYFEDTDDFAPMELPEGLDDDYIVPEMAVQFKAQPSYPKYEELEYHSSMECDWDEYDEALARMGVDMDAENHKLLGYADIIQNEMLSECERVTRGIYCGDPSGYQNASEDEEASILRGAKDWILLLQLTTLENEDFELMWGDCGMLYFYIKRQDLAARRFENAWFSLQCG
jgi:uncharacterized protein YwqG